MSDEFYDDDAQYDDPYDDDEIDDDDESVSGSYRSGSNPLFSSGSGLPGRSRYGSGTGSSSGISGRTGVRSYSAGGQNDDDDDDDDESISALRGGDSSSSSRSYFNRAGGGNSSPARSSRTSPGAEGGNSTRSPFTRSGSSDKGRSSPSSPSPSSSSSTPFANRYSRDSSGSGGSAPSSSSSGGSGGGYRRTSNTGGNTNRTNRTRESTETRAVKPDKKDDSGGNSVAKRFSASFGNLRSKLPGSGGDDKSKSDRSRTSGARQSGSRDKKDDSGGIMSRVRSSLPIGGNADNKKSPSRGDKSSSGGGPGALIGGMASRFLGGNKDDNKGGSSKSNDRSASRTSNTNARSSPSVGAGRFGGNRYKSGGDGKTSNTAASSTSDVKRSPFGQRGGAKKDSGSNKRSQEGGGLFGRVASSIPFVGGGGGADAKPQRTSKTRRAQSKVPKAKDDSGLSLDDKLDILGVVLVVTSLVLFVSSLSPQQGAITGTINDIISQVFGWGALGVPAIMMAIGMWLIVRHFGEDAPEIDPVRISGLAMLYVGGLMLFQFAETFNEIYRYANQDTLYLFVQESISQGRGGGMIGAELYYLVISNVGEMAGMLVIFGWVVVGLMLTTRTTAGELAVFVISIWRSFQVSMQQRSQARAVAQLEAQQSEAISVSRPASAELASGSNGALPAPSASGEVPIEERAIPIRMGGQMISQREQVENMPTTLPGEQQPAIVAQSVSATAEEDSSNGLIGGIAARLRGAVPLPVGGSDDNTNNGKQSTNGDDSSSGLFGGLFNRGSSSDEKSTTTPAKAPASAPDQNRQSDGSSVAGNVAAFGAGVAAASIGSLIGGGNDNEDTAGASQRPAAYQPNSAVASQSATATPDSVQVPPARTAGGSAPGSVNPSRYSRPDNTGQVLSPTPDRTSPFGDDDDDVMSRLPPAQPKGVARRPQSSQPATTSSFASRYSTPTKSDEDEDKNANKTTADSTTSDDNPIAARISRMNAIRSGNIKPPEDTELRSTMLDDDDESVNVARPSAEDIFGKPTNPASTPVTASDGDSGASPRVRAFDPNAMRNRSATSGTSTTNTVSSTPASSPAKPAPRQPAATLQSTPSSEPPVRSAADQRNGNEPVINLPTAPKPAQQPVASQRQWRLPDYKTLLASGSEQDFDREGLVRRARVIEETLQSFGAPGRVVEINTGPVITQFGVEPDYLTARGGKRSRVKVSAIAQLDKDLQLALGAKSIRVEAPVPGKGYVGIEVPNEEAALVSLRDVMESRQFNKIGEKSPLAIGLGQSVDGSPIAADLASMPHLLVAGTTGSGKSVLVNAIITSILVRNTPELVKFIMVDPKRVELTGYNGIPHLVAPVVVELERIVGVLKWVTREMDERYKRFSEAGSRNIEDFNKNLKPGMEAMPYIVVVIDELADLMMLAPDETERVITRIAALARATGIHLVIATQRPSVDVVTGLIKANFPARIAFAVASGTDSRVILDQPGADRLLGRGDMLYLSGDSPAPLRLQGVFVSDMEINNIVRYWRTQAPPDAQKKPITALVMDDKPTSRSVMPKGERFMQPPPASTQRAFWDKDTASNDNLTEGEREAQDQADELYTDAVELVRRLNKASVSLLQRRLRIGYTRAARMIDMMEAENIIGPPTEGSKPREVLPFKK